MDLDTNDKLRGDPDVKKLGSATGENIFEPVQCVGKMAHPLYKWLKKHGVEIDYNWEKVLLNEDGCIVKHYKDDINPDEIRKDIDELLKK